MWHVPWNHAFTHYRNLLISLLLPRLARPVPQIKPPAQSGEGSYRSFRGQGKVQRTAHPLDFEWMHRHSSCQLFAWYGLRVSFWVPPTLKVCDPNHRWTLRLQNQMLAAARELK